MFAYILKREIDYESFLNFDTFLKLQWNGSDICNNNLYLW